jgi:uncharacterized protein (DUF885 family)
VSGRRGRVSPALLVTITWAWIAALGVAAPAVAADGSAAGVAPAANPAAAAVDQLAAETWQRQVSRSPALRLARGLPVEHLPDLSHEAAAAEARWAGVALERLATVDLAALDHERWLTARLLDHQLRLILDGLPHFWHQFQVTPYTWSFNGVQEAFAGHPLTDEEQTARYLALLDELPRVARQARENLEEQRRRGILLPRAELDAVTSLMGALAATGEASPFRPAAERLAALGEERAAAVLAEVDRRVAASVAPAFAALGATLQGDYRAATPERVGLGSYPGGAEAYRYLIRVHTGLDLSPQEVHDLGVGETTRIAAEMAELRALLGSEEPMAEYHAALRSDPRFLACDAAGVGERLMAAVRRIEPLVDGWFLRTPAAPHGVERLQPELEGAMTFGYYDPPKPTQEVGRYLFNGSRLQERTLVTAAALIYHELVPGHHFQIALQRENTSLPEIRRESYPTAYVEGWAEYASDLAGEMGLYREPYDRYGRLGMDMFLSARLVVDTGMNALGWSLDDARAFLRAHVLESDTQLASETLRYAVDIPGQALAYKLGSLRIRALRDRAAAQLGERFDVRRFHEAVLGVGALPLPILEEHVDWWIAQEARR